MADKKSLGKNVPMDELERVAVIQAIDTAINSGVKGWALIKALESVKEKTKFTDDEMNTLRARGKEQEKIAQGKPLLKKVGK